MESNMEVSQKYFLIELAYHPAILLLFLSEEKEITNLEQYMHPYGGSAVKNLLAKAGHLGSIPRSGRSPGEENGNLLHYSCMGHPMVGYSPWGHKESHTVEQLNNNKILLYFCPNLENSFKAIF